MPSSADIVREACRVIWSEGQVERVPEFYSEDFKSDYPVTDWGTGLGRIQRAVKKSVFAT